MIFSGCDCLTVRPGLRELKQTLIITMMIFRIREEWSGVPLPRTRLHAWLGRVHTTVARTLSQYIWCLTRDHIVTSRENYVRKRHSGTILDDNCPVNLKLSFHLQKFSSWTLEIIPDCPLATLGCNASHQISSSHPCPASGFVLCHALCSQVSTLA